METAKETKRHRPIYTSFIRAPSVFFLKYARPSKIGHCIPSNIILLFTELLPYRTAGDNMFVLKPSAKMRKKLGLCDVPDEVLFYGINQHGISVYNGDEV